MKSDCIFIHVPRTGGRSIEDACYTSPEEMPIRATPTVHATVKSYIAVLGEENVNRMFKFTVIRNPWDRVLSWWRAFVNENPSITPYTNDFDLWVRNIDLQNHMSYYKNSRGEVKIDYFIEFEELEKGFGSIAERVGAVKPLGVIGDTMPSSPLEKPQVRPRVNYRDYFKTQEAIDIVGLRENELITRFGYTY